ncbi:class I SAM-dependent methyltransferase [Streptomyces sp. TRM68367]|uniref:class I SAM-dependent DNA methyltransferase n=1 Tax=Streptomyces sp. TRM68367 TaxID=2758415 RepID=UPI00165C31FA|nr:class I SAM-dependent methyltransferase [Streptomyces sp. TRM68367]MBC9727799.1 class I SAM-dependent methyltransferase [Streptomyces sp. TRM68367]
MTDSDFLITTRTFYDSFAETYADLFRDIFAGRELDRAVLTGFAGLVGADGGQVADLGCGPGRVTAFLDSLGLSVFGVDLSESMLAIARRENPGLRFEQGSMLELDLPDGALAGVLSWYSIIHTPEERLPELFAEFRRVLAPGGHLLVAFQVGDQPKRHERPYGHPVSLDFQRRQPDKVAALLEEAGFGIRARMVREPEEGTTESTPQAYLFAHKPARKPARKPAS